MPVKVPLQVDVVDVPPQVLQVNVSILFVIQLILINVFCCHLGQNKAREPNTLPCDTKTKNSSTPVP